MMIMVMGARARGSSSSRRRKKKKKKRERLLKAKARQRNDGGNGICNISAGGNGGRGGALMLAGNAESVFCTLWSAQLSLTLRPALDTLGVVTPLDTHTQPCHTVVASTQCALAASQECPAHHRLQHLTRETHARTHQMSPPVFRVCLRIDGRQIDARPSGRRVQLAACNLPSNIRIWAVAACASASASWPPPLPWPWPWSTCQDTPRQTIQRQSCSLSLGCYQQHQESRRKGRGGEGRAGQGRAVCNECRYVPRLSVRGWPAQGSQRRAGYPRTPTTV
jgi:hypothetical protein